MTERLALVTGGVGELGQSIVRQLLDDGRRVVAFDLNADSAEAAEWHDALGNLKARVYRYKGDVADFDGCHEVIERICEELGPPEILVNCAGITRDATLKKMEQHHWESVLRVNLDSVFNVTRQLINPMITAKYGRIVNISSVNGVKGQFGQANYASAKAGMHGFTMSLAQEVARYGVTVNTVAPGYMRTKMVSSVPQEVLDGIVSQIPVGRLGETREIAAVVRFLCSDDAAFVTGACFNANGGQHMH